MDFSSAVQRPQVVNICALVPLLVMGLFHGAGILGQQGLVHG